ncbi:(2Fe-2S)-binding protein [Niabella insulamsoli]|uniref:(2Fe-2S)-binding protein n=1 Tax=Niabella insulamsoli TaxID=3144874 RepID=UPI0031FC3093
MALYTINVNGAAKQVDAAPDTPILWVLRDHLRLLGTKYGCGVAHCGVCTIHLDGDAVRSCVYPISDIGTKKIVTIEGLSEKGDHPVQKAWLEWDVPQCGYCQAGQIMTAASLLAQNPQPTDEEIRRAMNGNLCRCATYTRINKAIRTAAKEM